MAELIGRSVLRGNIYAREYATSTIGSFEFTSVAAATVPFTVTPEPAVSYYLELDSSSLRHLAAIGALIDARGILYGRPYDEEAGSV